MATITLKTLPQATEQQVFDQVATHLLTQGRKSENAGTCLYRGPEGTKCAAGCLIGKSEYRAYWEGRSWSGLAGEGSVPEEHLDLIIALQKIHDHPDWRLRTLARSWREKLIKLANEFELSYKVVEDFNEKQV